MKKLVEEYTDIQVRAKALIWDSHYLFQKSDNIGSIYRGAREVKRSSLQITDDASASFTFKVNTLVSNRTRIPDYPDAYIKLAEVYIQKDKKEAAIKIFETGVLKNPDSALLSNNLASLYLEKNQDINKAFKLARFAYEHVPDDPAVVDSFGWAYYKKNMFVQAGGHLRYAFVLSSENEVVIGHLGSAEKAFEGFGRLWKGNNF